MDNQSAATVRYCAGCGRECERQLRRAGYRDTKTGEHVYEQALVCPRFDRSWRNLWLGGWRHFGYLLTDEDDERSPFGTIPMQMEWS